jgi:uncharacterized protein
MVSRGQYLERPALIPLGAEVLEGLWHRGERTPPLLIVPPPPGTGSMDHVVCAELAWAAARAGYPVLRFNFRGVGASQGAVGDAASRVEDADAALRLLRENTDTVDVVVAVVGESLDTGLRLAQLHPGLLGCVLVSPPADPELVRASVPLLCIVGALEPGQAGLAALVQQAGGRLVPVPEADARFLRHLPRIGRATVEWLARLAKAPGS